MRKNLISRLFMLVAMITVMASCTKKSSEYTNVIPADASAVIGIHIQSLIDKSGVSDDNKQKLINVLKSEMTAATFQQVEKIIKDGSASGLSIKDPIYIFSSDKLSSAAVAIKVNDMDKFTKTLGAILPELSNESIKNGDGYSMFKIDGGVCAYNESTLLMIESSYDDNVVSALMNQNKEQSIAENAYYKGMSDKKGDLRFFFTLNALPNRYKRQMGMTLNGMENVDPKDIAVIGGLSFEKGRIAVHTETTSNKEEVKEMFKKQNDLYGKLNETFLNNFPASTLMYMSLNMSGEKLYDMLQENQDFRESLSLDKAEKIKDVFSAFKGDISLGLINVTMGDMPTFTAYAEASSGTALNTLYQSKAELGLGRSEDIVKLGENQYVFKSRQMNIFFGFKDKYMYATNSELINKNIGKKEDKSLKDAAYASNMKGKYQYVAIDMKNILELPVVKVLSTMGSREVAIYMNVASKVSYFEAVGEGNNQMNMNIWLVDKDTNSLKQIVDLVKQYAGV